MSNPAVDIRTAPSSRIERDSVPAVAVPQTAQARQDATTDPGPGERSGISGAVAAELIAEEVKLADGLNEIAATDASADTDVPSHAGASAIGPAGQPDDAAPVGAAPEIGVGDDGSHD